MENNELKKEPKIHIFGEEVKDHSNQHNHKYYKKDHRGNEIFGLLIVFFGFVFLLSNFGLITTEFWHFVLPFWPVLLILIGFKVILGHNWFSSFIIFIITLAFLVVVFIYGLFKINSPSTNYFSPDVRFFINNLNQ